MHYHLLASWLTQFLQERNVDVSKLPAGGQPQHGASSDNGAGLNMSARRGSDGNITKAGSSKGKVEVLRRGQSAHVDAAKMQPLIDAKRKPRDWFIGQADVGMRTLEAKLQPMVNRSMDKFSATLLSN